jgi:lipoprotein-anchoring transpeptidase ErfK/SrfK
MGPDAAGSFPQRLILIAAIALLRVDSVEHPHVSVPSLLEHAATRPAGLFEDRILKTTTLTCAVILALYSATGSFVFAAVAPAAPRAVALPLTAEHANDASLRGDVGPKQRNVAVLRVQILLDRARFFPGEVDASFGSNTRIAISGFQRNNGLPASGAMDESTWAALNSDVEPVLVSYTLTEADVAGPFTQIPADMMDKASLPALGYRNVAEALGEKFHASPALLAELNPGKDLGRAGEAIVVPNLASAAPLAKAARVVVDKSDSTVTLFDAADAVIAQFPASTGSSRDPLPLGEWKILGVARNPEFKYNPKLFWDANPAHAKATIPPGPNNPVGVAWVALSKPHYGIHGTPEPSKIGKTQSHGCIRLTNWNVEAMGHSVSPGLPALLQE